jgi:hypothetical protein
MLDLFIYRRVQYRVSQKFRIFGFMSVARFKRRCRVDRTPYMTGKKKQGEGLPMPN